MRTRWARFRAMTPQARAWVHVETGCVLIALTLAAVLVMMLLD